MISPDVSWDAVNAAATLILAAASVLVAAMSWHTARRANALTETAQERDRARTRRMIALEVHEWAQAADAALTRGIFTPSEMFPRERELSARCRIEGEAEGVMIIDSLGARVKAFHRYRLHRPEGWTPGAVDLPPWTRRYPELALLRVWTEDPRRTGQKALELLTESGELMVTESMAARERRNTAQRRATAPRHGLKWSRRRRHPRA